jgi:DNA-binding GntR family transcriptional regulator
VNDDINRSVSLSDQATAILRRRIVEGVYAPGERLIEVDLAATFEISRAPLREALRSLAQEGMVIHRPNKGFYVPAITLEDARSLYEFREAIETAAARWAAIRITADEIQVMMSRLAALEESLVDDSQSLPTVPMDLDFHLTIIEGAHSPLLERRAKEINQQLQFFRQRGAYAHERAKAAHVEHIAIANAIAERNPDKSERAMRRHQKKLQEYALAAISESPVVPIDITSRIAR